MLSRPPMFTPSRPDAPHTYDREFENNETALGWLQNQGNFFPRLFLCFNLLRDGATNAVNTLEAHHYPWGSPSNADFHFLLLLWEGVPYMVVSVPGKDSQQVSDSLATVGRGFRIVWGEPHHIHYAKTGNITATVWREGRDPSVDGSTCFPLRGDNVGTVEFIPHGRAPIVAGGAIYPTENTSEQPQNRKARRSQQRQSRREERNG